MDLGVVRGVAAALRGGQVGSGCLGVDHGEAFQLRDVTKACISAHEGIQRIPLVEVQSSGELECIQSAEVSGDASCGEEPNCVVQVAPCQRDDTESSDLKIGIESPSQKAEFLCGYLAGAHAPGEG